MTERYENRLHKYRQEAGASQATLGASLAHPMHRSDLSKIERGMAHGKPLLPLPETAQDFVTTLSGLLNRSLTVKQVFPGLKKRWAKRCCVRGGRRTRGGA